MLPWDLWGAAMAAIDDHATFLDRLAALTLEPDAHRDELAEVLTTDERVRLPDQVFNALRGRAEPV